MNYSHHFKNKKITVMGLGLLGRAAGDAEFLAEQGAELIITDLKSEVELAPSVARLKRFSNIIYRLGRHDLEDFRSRDFILKAAGIPFDSLYIEEARKNGIPIKMSASWFAELAQIPVVGVTGTRGKTTTTMMLYDIMKASGSTNSTGSPQASSGQAGMDVLLGGNIRGVSTLALLPEVKNDSIALMELDSWQARGFGDEKMSPSVAVFTTLFDDHLNYYRGDRKRYFDDKAQIFLHQESDDTLVASKAVAQKIKDEYGSRVRSKLVVADEKPFPKGWTLTVPGVHNVLNAECALAASRALGIDDEISKQALAEFKGVSGRLELIREINGIKIYNDTTSTTPEATLAGLEALRQSSGQNQNLILILGGFDKGLIMNSVVEEAKKRAKKIIFLSGTGTDTIKDQFPDAPVYENLKDAVADAFTSAMAGDVILFSPAFASFGMFKNEFDRGDQFNELVKAL